MRIKRTPKCRPKMILPSSHKAELPSFMSVAWPTGVQLSFAPVFQWCCLIPQGSPGVGRNTLFLSSPHLCFIIVFIRGLFVSRDDPPSRGLNNYNCMF